MQNCVAKRTRSAGPSEEAASTSSGMQGIAAKKCLPNLGDLMRDWGPRYFNFDFRAYTIRWENGMTRLLGVTDTATKIIAISTYFYRKDKWTPDQLKEVILHEMIHAWNHLHCVNDSIDDHGPSFKSHAKRLNKLLGLNISSVPYHGKLLTWKWKCSHCEKIMETSRDAPPNAIWQPFEDRSAHSDCPKGSWVLLETCQHNANNGKSEVKKVKLTQPMN